MVQCKCKLIELNVNCVSQQCKFTRIHSRAKSEIDMVINVPWICKTFDKDFEIEKLSWS